VLKIGKSQLIYNEELIKYAPANLLQKAVVNNLFNAPSSYTTNIYEFSYKDEGWAL